MRALVADILIWSVFASELHPSLADRRIQLMIIIANNPWLNLEKKKCKKSEQNTKRWNLETAYKI